MRFIQRFLFLSLVTFSAAQAAELSYITYETVYEENEILHEMMIGCVSTKNECRTLAHHQGYSTSRIQKDAVRCPKKPKTLACIVKH